jgi:hypothetical protein
MKVKVLLLSLVVLIATFAGCAKKPAPQQQNPPQTTPPETTPDVKTSASIVNNAAAFQKAISSTGTWIIAITQDLTINNDLVMDGEFKNGKKDASGKDIIQRKLALYSQDDKRNITARFTLTAPKITVNSPEASFQHGTFKGDVYVSAKDFSLIDATVDGNIYFTTDEAQSTFKMDATSKVTGAQQLKK